MIINWLIRALILTSFWAATIWAQDGSAALVKVAQAEMKNIAPVTLVPGTVISRDDARVAAEVSGRLMDVAEVGDAFEAGEVVARIDDTRFKLLKTELAADITRAEAQVRFLEGEEKRFAKLAESNLAATTQLEQTRSERDVSLADLEVARSRLAQNEDQLARTRIRAPFSGIVVERLKTPGERVSEGELVVRLVDHNRLEVVARAPLDYYSFTQPGQTLEVRSSRQTTMARVRTVVAVGDQDTHQFELRLDLETGPFPVGQTVRVAVPFDEQREALTVPRDALVLRPEGQTVFVVNGDNEAKRVEVTTGVGSGADIEVFGDIHAGDTVVIRGNERLQAGQSVTIIEG
jgi:RND family efflux transporter MFP subunit